MIVTRLGSLNAVEQTHTSSFWRRFLKGPLPSADTLGRVAALMEPEPIRKALLDLYACLKRNKALPPAWHGLMALVLDGHESHATENRHCPGCLERTITTLRGEAADELPARLRRGPRRCLVHRPSPVQLP